MHQKKPHISPIQAALHAAEGRIADIERRMTIARIDAALTRLHSTIDTPQASDEGQYVPPSRTYPGPPSMTAWKRYVTIRSKMIMCDGEDLHIPCLACGVTIPYAVGLGTKTGGGRIRVGCVIGLRQDDDETVEPIEPDTLKVAIFSDYDNGVIDAPTALSRIGAIPTIDFPEPVETVKRLYVPIHAQGAGCVTCQGLFMTVVSETMRYNVANRANRVPFLEVEPRDLVDTIQE